MNKGELVDVLAQKLNANKYQIDSFITAFLETVVETLENKESIDLVGFGVWSVRPVAPRTGTNPATGEPISIPARWTASFKIGKAFKERIETIPLDADAPGVSNVVLTNITAATDKPYTFTLTYNDANSGIRVGTIGRDEMKPENLDILVTGPSDYSQKAKAIKTKTTADGKGKTVTYSIGAPGGMWDATANGQYLVELLAGQITDNQGNAIAPGPLGNFLVSIS